MGMDGRSFTMRSGTPLEVIVDGDNVMAGGVNILRYDIEASNGVIHVINAVLSSPAG